MIGLINLNTYYLYSFIKTFIIDLYDHDSLNSSKGLYGNTRATMILPLGFTAFFISSKSFVGLLHRSNKFRHDTTSNFSSRVHHVSTSNNLLTTRYYLDTIMTTVSIHTICIDIDTSYTNWHGLILIKLCIIYLIYTIIMTMDKSKNYLCG